MEPVDAKVLYDYGTHVVVLPKHVPVGRIARIATDRAWLAEHGLRLPADSTPEHVAWCVRRLRERLGLELRARDRQQATRQLEDLGAL